MARVVRRVASALARRPPSRAVQRRARKHKVIMESVTQEKKKLRSVICFEARAPSGYTFIPAGNPLLTTTCKERCRKEGLQIHAVSTTPHTRTHNLSQHVHRIGYHFPSTVVAAACSELGLYLTSTGKAVPFHTLGSIENRPPADVEISQLTINTEARDAIKDLFPSIPQHDLYQIIKTAFQKGQRKVGTASELPLARRAQLAVVAHIRHLYTDYDRLLKRKSFHEARSAVEQTTLAKVIEWRGDDENGQTVLEDVFREVIVISDDDDSETEEEGAAIAGTRDQSVEILSSNARPLEIQTQPVSTVKFTAQDPARELSEEAPPGYRIVARMPAKKTIDRRGFSRYQAWNRALSRYRAGAHAIEQSRLDDAPAEQQSPRNAKRPAAAQEISDPVRRRDAPPQPMGAASRVVPGPAQVSHAAQRVHAVAAMDWPTGKNHVGVPEWHASLEDQRALSQHGSSGRPFALTTQNSPEVRVLEKNPHPRGSVVYSQGMFRSDMSSDAQAEMFPVSSHDRANAPVFVSGPRELQQSSKPQVESRTELLSSHYSRPGEIPQDHVLPSIENPWPLEKRLADGRLEHLTKRMSLRSVTPVPPQGDNSQHGHVGGPSSLDDTDCKRRRLAHYVAPRHDSRPGTWNARPIGVHASEALTPRGQYHREGVVPKRRSQEGLYFRRDLPPADQPLLVGHQRERKPVPPAAPQTSLHARPTLDRRRILDPHQHVSVHQSQPGPPKANGTYATGDHAFRTALDAPRPEVHPVYYAERSPRMGRVRPSKLEEPRAPVWKPPIDGDLAAHDASSGGKLYADDFVRHVDIREVRPVEYFINCPRPQSSRAGENTGQPTRMRISDHHAVQNLSQTQGHSEQHQPPSPRVVAHASQDQTSHRLEAVTGNHPPHRSSSRPRHPGSGLSATRRVHDPRSFQMAEQSRPIYVKRVESQPPQYAVPDGRHVVIVD